jgi:hypothetical protein
MNSVLGKKKSSSESPRLSVLDRDSGTYRIWHIANCEWLSSSCHSPHHASRISKIHCLIQPLRPWPSLIRFPDPVSSCHEPPCCCLPSPDSLPRADPSSGDLGLFCIPDQARSAVCAQHSLPSSVLLPGPDPSCGAPSHFASES